MISNAMLHEFCHRQTIHCIYLNLNPSTYHLAIQTESINAI